MSRTILAGVATAVLMTVAAVPAHAGSSNVAKSVEVDIAGIDLTTDAGTELVLRKVRRAAEDACDVKPGRRTLTEMSDSRACVDKAMEQAIESLSAKRAYQAAVKAGSEG